MPWKYNDRVIRAGKAWSDDNGIQHPSNWMIWDDAEKVSRGLVWENDPVPVDQRFYWDTDIPRNLDDVVQIDSETSVTITDNLDNPVYSFGLKTQYKNQTNETANSLLSLTDWMIIANAERSRVIPTSVTNYRAAVVSCCGVIKTNITACTSIGGFINLFETPTSGTGEDVVVEGPAPIYAWPDRREF
tara:strand:+ start:2865 stop:3428 length:564 start_codon:yes stop_codon:yes gene_type:complete